MSDTTNSRETQALSMIERVARAISAAFREEGAFWDGAWETDIEQSAFHDAARAAIEAMREPTAEMEAHMREVFPAGSPPTRRWQWLWSELIGKALDE
jgi:hypothetical protein